MYQEMALEMLRRRFPLCTVSVSHEMAPEAFLEHHMTLRAEACDPSGRRHAVQARILRSEMMETRCSPRDMIERVVENMARHAVGL